MVWYGQVWYGRGMMVVDIGWPRKKKEKRFGVRGPVLDRVTVHAPECRGHTFNLKNACASCGKNRKSVTKAQKCLIKQKKLNSTIYLLLAFS